MLSKIDQKKLLDAGQVDQVKAEITKNFQQQLDEEKQRSQMLEKQLYDSMIGGSFAGSKYIADKIAIPADLLQARFGQAFKVEEGRIVAYDASGNKIYSRAKPGELAQFDERWVPCRKLPSERLHPESQWQQWRRLPSDTA